jgi:tetratricopeptide (TPR) repeat protein
MAEGHAAVEVFCSYAHEDEEWLRLMETHLSLLKRQGLIAFWHDRLISPGVDWTESIDTHLERASVILFFISADFLASDYCYGIEMKRALERQEAGEARVIPILVRSVDWQTAPFAHLNALPTNAKPLTTWSDRDTALADVTAGIRRVIGELPQMAVSAPRAALPAVWNIPYRRNPYFTGREDILQQLTEAFKTGNSAAISGLGGIGKTQSAVEYAYRSQQDYQVVLWARADTREQLIADVVAIAGLLRLQEKDAQDQNETVEAVKRWLQGHRDWLLILDNADDLAMVSAFIPPAFDGHLLLTTRARVMGRVAHRVQIERMEPEEGALFLLRRAGIISERDVIGEASAVEQTRAKHISLAMDGLPLALDQTGAYIEETACGLAGYLDLYKQRGAELLARRGGLIGDHPEPVATTWSLSFEKVEQKSLTAANLLRLCAFLAPDAIPEDIISQGVAEPGPDYEPVAMDAFELNAAIEALQAFSLVKRNTEMHTLSIHRLVQAVIRDAMDQHTQQQWAERALRAVYAVLPAVEHGTWPEWERIVAHAQACSQQLERYRIQLPEGAEVMQQTGWYLTERARYPEAEPLLEQAYAMSERVQGPEHLDTARDGLTLAYLYETQGKYKEAEPLLQRALAIYEQQLGEQHPDTAQSLNNLAELYYAQSKYEEAEPLYQRALAIREQLGEQHPDTAQSLNNLAELYYAQGKYKEAEPLYQRALAIREQQLGEQHPLTATSLNNLAALFDEQSKYEEAEPLYQRALAIREQQLGEQHPDTAGSLNNLALLYQAQGKYEEAEPLYERSLAIYTRVFGAQHHVTKTIQRNFDGFLKEKQRYQG